MAVIPTTRNSAVSVDTLPLLDLLVAMAEAIRDDNTLDCWCLTNYGRNVTIFSGSDPADPPGADSYPVVEVYPIEDNYGREIKRHERIIGLTCGICDEAVESVQYYALSMQQGVLHLEEFFRLVLSAAMGADLSGGYIATVKAVRSEENLFPYFLIGAELHIIQPL